MATQRSKHTIEVEVEWADEGMYSNLTLHGADLFYTDVGLSTLGITRPAPPYEPRSDDIVRLGNGWVDEVRQVGQAGGISLVRAGDGYTASELTLVYRPEATQ